MKVLLDENLAHQLRTHLPAHETATAAYVGFGGFKNGELLDAAEAAGFNVLVTGDLSLEYEQNMAYRKIAVISLSAHNWPIIKHHVARIAAAVDGAKPGNVTRVDCGSFVRTLRSRKGPIPG